MALPVFMTKENISKSYLKLRIEVPIIDGNTTARLYNMLRLLTK